MGEMEKIRKSKEEKEVQSRCHAEKEQQTMGQTAHYEDMSVLFIAILQRWHLHTKSPDIFLSAPPTIRSAVGVIRSLAEKTGEGGEKGKNSFCFPSLLTIIAHLSSTPQTAHGAISVHRCVVDVRPTHASRVAQVMAQRD